MVLHRKSIITFFMMGVFLIPACTANDGTDQKPAFQQVPELKVIAPERPVKIKLKRGASGQYSWEISGDDAERIIKANKTLKESVEKDE